MVDRSSLQLSIITCVVGAWLFVAFLFFISYNLVYAIRYNNQILILLILLYGLMMSFENILEREDGVIYFGFFIGFFALLSYNEQLNKDIPKSKNLEN